MTHRRVDELDLLDQQQRTRPLVGTPRPPAHFDPDALERRADRFFTGVALILTTAIVLAVILW